MGHRDKGNVVRGRFGSGRTRRWTSASDFNPQDTTERVGFRRFHQGSPHRHPQKKVSWMKFIPLYVAAVAFGGAYGAGAFDQFGGRTAEAATGGIRASFSSCHTGGGYNCVVDGDTIWLQGQKIRIADIDTPETHDPRCASEKQLGDRATQRLRQLLNHGAVTLQPIDRDQDRYGRKLRIVLVNGTSVGDTLVGEGLARWCGSGRRPWC
jgi:hypothetical protein